MEGGGGEAEGVWEGGDGGRTVEWRERVGGQGRRGFKWLGVAAGRTTETAADAGSCARIRWAFSGVSVFPAVVVVEVEVGAEAELLISLLTFLRLVVCWSNPCFCCCCDAAAEWAKGEEEEGDSSLKVAALATSGRLVLYCL